MPLTRKLLSAMGIAEEQAEQIITAHRETVDPLKQDIDVYKTKADQLDDVQKKLNAANSKIKQFEAQGEENPWKTKYDDLMKEKNDLQTEYDDYKSSVSAKELLSRKKEAYEKLLLDAGVVDKRIDTVIKCTDLSAIDFDENDENQLKDVDTLTANIKKEWSDFIGTQSTQGANVPTPQGTDGTGNVGKPGVSKPVSRAAQMAARYHADLYGSKEV